MPSPKRLSIEDVKEAWVLVFKQGTDDEDLCVDRTQHGRGPSLLAFEDTYDAEHFARLLQADGIDDLATAVCWGMRQLTSFSDESGMHVTIIPRGEVPAPSGGPESPYHQSPYHQSPYHQSPYHQSPYHQSPYHPGVPSGAHYARGNDAPDKHLPHLEDLLQRTPDNCGDEDCSVPADGELTAPLGPDAATPHGGLLREQAMAAVDAIMATGNSTMDLPTLMQSAWESVKAVTPENQSTDEEEQ